MIEPCTLEQLQTSRQTLRALASSADRAFRLAELQGKKMRELRGLENETRAAWTRVYAIENRIYRLVTR